AHDARRQEPCVEELGANATSEKFAQDDRDRDQASERDHEKQEGDVELRPDLTDVCVVPGQVGIGGRNPDAHDGDEHPGRNRERAIRPGHHPPGAGPGIVGHSAWRTSTTLVRAAQRPGIIAAAMATTTPVSGIAISSQAPNTLYAIGGVSFPAELLIASFKTCSEERPSGMATSPPTNA